MHALAAFLLGVFPCEWYVCPVSSVVQQLVVWVDPHPRSVAEPIDHGSDIHFALDRRGSEAEHVPVVADRSRQSGSAIRAARRRVSARAAAV
ncbi:hypothetical protein K438DRAFT_1936279, partial [Mycena galopus ATCC 62051]